jgi:hypothetical protein
MIYGRRDQYYNPIYFKRGFCDQDKKFSPMTYHSGIGGIEKSWNR